MTLISRYIFRQAFGALLMILLSLTAIVWIALALKQLSLITSGGAGGIAFLEITGLILPDIMATIAPIAMMIAALYTLNKLNQDSELIVMTAAGASVSRLSRPLVILALLLATTLVLANFLVTPWSQRKLSELINQLRTDLISQALEPGSFASPEDGLMFHIRERSNDGHLLGLLMDDTRAPNEQLTYVADTGEVVKRSDKAYLVLHDGHVVRHVANQQTTIIEFDSYMLDLATVKSKGKIEGPKPHARYVSELLNPDPNDGVYLANPGSFRAELHERFASVLYPFLFIAIVVASLGQARTNRQSRNQAQISAFGLSAFLKITGIAATNLVASNQWAIALVYGLPVGGIAVSLLALRFGSVLKLPAPLKRALVGATEALAAAGARLVQPIRLRRGGAS